ncbi:DUF5753 domain-containing protein [Streptomyces poonensis]|uniref:DUF5753 domain-containing protein n=1 Tax=Streptomyces poonensis TaxID=68255 RepID=A0A918PB81_9ACTN|nr:DUF5753 domain-containing protein [Streptomyces poonensis]GGY96200.1 hypothetical protein GCM10010365_13900 [Streptomyces poonensis]GLJ88921.1 hypothetical protein GCM10017589_15210 [Streptomyces poonensis]
MAARLGRQLLLHRCPVPDVRFVVDEYAFRRPSQTARTWEDQLLRIETAAMWPNVVIQVLPFTAGPHGMDVSLTLLWQESGSAVAYKEGNGLGVLMNEAEDVTRHRLSYDRLRDVALSPADSLTFIRGVLKEHTS